MAIFIIPKTDFFIVKPNGNRPLLRQLCHIQIIEFLSIFCAFIISFFTLIFSSIFSQKNHKNYVWNREGVFSIKDSVLSYGLIPVTKNTFVIRTPLNFARYFRQVDLINLKLLLVLPFHNNLMIPKYEIPIYSPGFTHDSSILL